MDRLTRLFVVIMCVLTAAIGIAQASVTTVTLRGTVRLTPEQPVTLDAIADIVGDQSHTLGTLVIDTDPVLPGAWTRLGVQPVRDAIADSVAKEGSIVVVGSAVSITRVEPRPTVPIAIPAAPAPETPGTTVRDHLASWLTARFDATPEAIRITHDARDADTLDTPTDGRAVEILEIGMSNRIALRVTVYAADTIVLTQTLRTGVEVRRDAWITTRPLRRGERVAPEDVRADTVWCDPTDPPADTRSVIGQVVRRSVEPGSMVRDAMLEAPVLIERGRDVSVRSIRGSVVVTTTARAREDGRLGDVIELDSKDRSGRRFSARVAGPGRAVLIDPALAHETSPEMPATHPEPASGEESPR